MVFRVRVCLYAEEIFRVTEVRCERGRSLLHIGEQFGKSFAPCLGNRVSRVNNIERDISCVCIDYSFNAVARIVETVIQATTRCELIGIRRLRIRVAAR